jgi:hypothetical protein
MVCKSVRDHFTPADGPFCIPKGSVTALLTTLGITTNLIGDRRTRSMLDLLRPEYPSLPGSTVTRNDLDGPVRQVS